MKQFIGYQGYVCIWSKIAPGKVIDVSQDSSDYGTLLIYDYHYGANQHFQIVFHQNDTISLHSQLSKKVITVSNESDMNGAKLIEEADNGKAGQRFKIQETLQGSDEFIIKTFCGKVIDIYEGKNKNGTNVIQWDYHGNSNQIWNIKKI